ncbi:hypothetical protein GQ473_03025 [archaeon]|nr:hypothetical protein [archaeon]
MVDIMYTNSKSNTRHPELKPGEFFQTNIPLKCLHEKDLTNCRVGKIAYDVNGNITNNAVPIFKLQTNEYKISNKEFIKQIVIFALDNDLSFTVESGGKIEIYLYTDLKVTITQNMVSIPSIATDKIVHLLQLLESIQIGHKEELCQIQ